MNGEQTTQQGERVVYERCACRQMMDFFCNVTGLGNQDARRHFRNSRVEVLKGFRAILDARIDKLSGTAAQGSSIKVE
jgi:ABC-type Na+ transport system ATPase subunit NatA